MTSTEIHRDYRQKHDGWMFNKKQNITFADKYNLLKNEGKNTSGWAEWAKNTSSVPVKNFGEYLSKRLVYDYLLTPVESSMTV
jgi:hypothetical protein